MEINLYKLFGVGALARRGLPPVGGLCGMCHWLSPHRTFLPVRAVQITATPCLRDRYRADWRDFLQLGCGWSVLDVVRCEPGELLCW